MSYHKRKTLVTDTQKKKRKMSTVNYSVTNRVIDHQTGEVIETSQIQGRREEREPQFVKLYLDQILLFEGVRGIPSDVLFALSMNISGFSDQPDSASYFRYDKLTKTKMMEYLGIKESMLNRYIKKIVEAGLIIKTEMRGVYIANPCIIAKGQWKYIRDLQLHFDCIQGKWKCDLVTSKEQ